MTAYIQGFNFNTPQILKTLSSTLFTYSHRAKVTAKEFFTSPTQPLVPNVSQLYKIPIVAIAIAGVVAVCTALWKYYLTGDTTETTPLTPNKTTNANNSDQAHNPDPTHSISSPTTDKLTHPDGSNQSAPSLVEGVDFQDLKQGVLRWLKPTQTALRAGELRGKNPYGGIKDPTMVDLWNKVEQLAVEIRAKVDARVNAKDIESIQYQFDAAFENYLQALTILLVRKKIADTIFRELDEFREKREFDGVSIPHQYNHLDQIAYVQEARLAWEKAAEPLKGLTIITIDIDRPCGEAFVRYTEALAQALSSQT